MNGQCVAGVVATTDNGQVLYPAGSAAPTDASILDTATGYKLTLTNTGTGTADVDGFAVAFYGTGGQEIASDEKDALNTSFITPGQSLTWTETADQQFKIVFTGQVADISCQLVHWYTP